ncbi:MAG TPA: tetratricopeptide repeat protein [Acidobacteriaceae bacterium]|nr:tetratricopeptide repeat protein [Acidobacteriaceae bacterium]
MNIGQQLDTAIDRGLSVCAAISSSLTSARRNTILRVYAGLLLIMVMCVSAPCQRPAASASITGRVLDSSGQPVAGAAVLLSGTASERTTSDSTGAFQFAGLAPGRYSLTTDTSATSIDVAPGAIARIELHPGSKPAGDRDSSAALTQAMQFADDPHFTIAGITDWTAAGGHGSDANLRTSEALNRESLQLQPDHPQSARCPDDEAALRADASSHPASFDASHCLGIFDLRTGKYAEAAKNLDAAWRLHPSDAANEYALAEACEKAGDMTRAREHFQKLSARQGSAGLHRLAGSVDETLGDPVAAVNEFAQAVRIDPSEQNYFAWGSELLYHRAVLQARDVFAEGVKAWPKSARMLTALGAALFAGALYDDAAERLCQAADLDPNNPEPYLFMGRIEVAAPRALPCVAQKLADFHRREPGNALADYYYAMSLWKEQPSVSDSPVRDQVAGLLHEAIKADPRCAEAWLELGNLQAQSGNYASAIPLYTKAIDSDPQLTQAYYRLGVAYDRTGERDKAREAFAEHDRIEKAQADQVDRQRRAIKQFVVSSAGTTPPGESPQH